ncbi:hypothetical protein MHZ92_08120 [Sporosarcina sp. ACRSL]|uniref:hypothetical protein n=1 Tax=Sporosarcina sp. ACRSL TaxID=2918215 RepID=UPI001EF3E8D4|nr:hypothetical protein [Sporosarcina sp. ACRSL]MCG7344094.1 hypothetical protein [Sporosarcina sp. ACRSL]
MNEMERELKDVGCIWSRRAVWKKGNEEVSFAIGYCANQAGASVIKVVVAESENTLVLQELVAHYRPEFVASGEGPIVWMDAVSFRKVEPPLFVSDSPLFRTEASINMVFLILFTDLARLKFCPEELRHLVDISLLARQMATSQEWACATTKEAFVQLTNHVDMDNSICSLLDDEAAERIVHHLAVLPLKSAELAVSYSKLVNGSIIDKLT